LGVNRCAYAEVEPDQDAFQITADYSEGVPSIVGRYYFSDFSPGYLRSIRAGQPYVVEDSATDPRSASVQETYRQVQVRSLICAPLLKAGRLLAALLVQSNRPRQWQQEEID